ncbi:HNH endonuclease [Nocardioides sp. zg-ZUI104]|uniref:HNH endonuclease signature motif containing protein n=1 Tax=Nocardioides faecalis TaxID=2803858 RepID=UPI001BCE19DC|nr:HNH endonuclease signature motif containing protein [Nocardioides faecalis]MBS4754606.1 HNH endonuclease [Nocardioides faecalis]
MTTSQLHSDQDALRSMSAEELLGFVESQHAARLEAERMLLRAARQWAVLHSPDALPVGDRRGRSRARSAGAEGTPKITEYAAAAFGARIQTSPYGARKLIADAVDIEHRLPQLHAGLDSGVVRVRCARHVAEATRELSAEEAAWVDGEVVDSADGRLLWARFEALVDGKVAAAAPHLARAREELAQTEMHVRMSRVNRHGMATLTIRDNAIVIMTAEAAITQVAKKLEDTIPEASRDERRVAAFAALVNPATHVDPEIRQIRPKVSAHLHFAIGTPVARLEGHGPVTMDWVRHTFATVAGRIKVTPVLDLAGQAPVDAYEIPQQLRDAVRLIHPADVFPYAASLARTGDIDHTIPYSEGGPTAIGNLAPMTRTHHRVKTHAGWEARQPFPGIVVWRDPYGAFYLVDPSGTRRVWGTGSRPALTRDDVTTTAVVLDGFAA